MYVLYIRIFFDVLLLIVFFFLAIHTVYIFLFFPVCVCVCVCYTGTAVLMVKLKCYTLSMQVAGPLWERLGSIYRGDVLGFLVQLLDTPFPS